MENCRKFVQDVLEAMHMEDVQVTASVDEEGALAKMCIRDRSLMVEWSLPPRMRPILFSEVSVMLRIKYMAWLLYTSRCV